MTNHKAVVEMLVAPELSADGIPWFATEADRLAYAQVHATLHLAEQQRLANVIAMATWNDSILRAGSLQFADIADEQTERIKIDRWFAEVRLGVNVK
jgi:hypothetical protein